MATLISNSTGNFTTAGTWSTVDATSLVDSEAGSTASTTSYVGPSATTTPGAITIDGLAFKVSSKTSGGTFTAHLYNSTDTAEVAGTAVTCNVADLPSQGWFVLTFAGVTLTAGKAYKVEIKTSSTGTVTLYRTASAGDWSHYMRTTTTAAPAASDILHIMGQITGAGATNSYTVTMDNTATTSFGSVTPPDGIGISKYGTLTWGTSASTNYNLKYKGRFKVYDGGTYNMGTSGTPVPSTSTATLTMDSATNVDTGLYFAPGSTYSFYGTSHGNNTYWTTLAANASASATSLTTAASTGWKNGDSIGLAPTQRVSTEFEKKALTADASGTTLTIAALTNAHAGGTWPTPRGHLIKLNRNIVVQGSSDTLQGYIYFDTTATGVAYYSEFYRLGSSTTGKRGFQLESTTGTADIQYCSFHDFIAASSIVSLGLTTPSTNNFTFSHNVSYNIINGGAYVGPMSTSSWTYSDVVVIGATGSIGITLTTITGTISDLVSAGGANGISIATNNLTATKSITGLEVYSTSAVGMNLTGMTNTISTTTLDTIKAWRCATYGIAFITTPSSSLILSNGVLFGNTTASMSVQGPGVQDAIIDSFTVNSETSFGSTLGLSISGVIKDVLISNSSFGATQAHSTADIGFTAVSVNNSSSSLFLQNTTLSSSTEVSWSGAVVKNVNQFISSQKHDATSGNNRFWGGYGTGNIDTTIYNTASPSLRLTPSSATVKFWSAPQNMGMKAAVASGGTLTPTVYVRKSVVGDGTAYNGNQPRLIVRKNVAAGISADTVLATYASAGGSWNALSGTTAAVTEDAVLEFYVDCDGTTGWINIDDWSVA